VVLLKHKSAAKDEDENKDEGFEIDSKGLQQGLATSGDLEEVQRQLTLGKNLGPPTVRIRELSGCSSSIHLFFCFFFFAYSAASLFFSGKTYDPSAEDVGTQVLFLFLIFLQHGFRSLVPL